VLKKGFGMNLILICGMVVVVPLGLRLVDGVPRWLPPIWVAAAGPGAVALWLERGALAASLALPYLVATLLLAALGTTHWLRRPTLAPRELALLTAATAPAVAGVSLVAERFGTSLFGFPLRIESLTVAHFHFAGFAAALIAALVSQSGDGWLATATALGVPAGILTVLIGFFTTRLIELAGAMLLTAAMWAVAWLSWQTARTARPGTATRMLLVVSASVLPVTMALAVLWAAGRATGLPHPSLDWMIATHGVLNGVGFGLCGMVAWRRLTPAQWRSDGRVHARIDVPGGRCEPVR
jgi:hypothetical protein